MFIRAFAIAALPLAAFGATIDFDGFTAGTILTNQLATSNVLFTPSGSLLSGRVTDVAANEFTTANFSNSNPMALFAADPGDVLLIDFVTSDGLNPLAASNVSFLAGDGDAAPDAFRVTFFDTALASISVQSFSTLTSGVTVGCPGCVVRRVQIEVLSPTTSPRSGMLIDDLSYQPVPEPSSMLLMSGGAGLLLWRLARRAYARA